MIIYKQEFYLWNLKIRYNCYSSDKNYAIINKNINKKINGL